MVSIIPCVRSFREKGDYRMVSQDVYIEASSELVGKARSGDTVAHDEIIVACASMIEGTARKYARYLHHSEESDLVQFAVLGMIERFHVALGKDSPVSYLVSCGLGRILEYIYRHDDFMRYADHGVPVLSLDKPLFPDDETSLSLLDTLAAPEPAVQSTPDRDFSALYEALDTLPSLQREAILRRYGLRGHPETRFAEMVSERVDRRQRRLERKRYSSRARDGVRALRRSSLLQQKGAAQ